MRVCSALRTSSSFELIDGSPNSFATISSTIEPASRRPCSLIRDQMSWPYWPSSRSVDRGVEPLRLARLGAELVLRLAELQDLALRDVERLEELLLGTCFAPASTMVRPSFVPTTIRSSSDWLSVSSSVGLTTSSPSIRPHPHRADRAEERQRRHGQCRRDAVDRQDVVRDDQVGRQHRRDALRLVAVALRPERPHRPVDHARRQDRPLGGAPLALEEAARDLPGGVHALLHVDREREEVRAFARLRPALRRGEHDGSPTADDDCAVGLLGELARFERDFLAADLDGDGNRHPGGVTASMMLIFSLLSSTVLPW